MTAVAGHWDRALDRTRGKLQTCQGLFRATGNALEVQECRRVATARQEYVPVSGVGTRITYRCGTHRIREDAPDLVETVRRAEGFRRAGGQP